MKAVESIPPTSNFANQMKFHMSLLLCACACAASLPAPGLVGALPGYGSTRSKQYAGQLNVNTTCGANLFFWMIESEKSPETDPTVIWFNGGPGSSSFIGLFLENGPYKITGNGTKLVDNPYGWNKFANYLMIDQPAGTGLSFTNSDACYAATEGLASDQLHTGLRLFFEKYNQYAGNPLFIASESYGGHYVPELATRVLAGNRAGVSPHINLQGIIVGDGWVNPLVASSTYADFAYSHGLVDLTQKEHVEELFNDCSAAIEDSLPVPSRKADDICNLVEEYIQNVSGAVNVYDVRKFGGEAIATDSVAAYINTHAVREALHLDHRTPQWQPSSDKVGYLLEEGEQGSTMELYPPLIGSIRVLIYNGIFDMDCNFMGTDKWLHEMDWFEGPGQTAWNKLGRVPWEIAAENNNTSTNEKRATLIAGHSKSVGNLTQLTLLGAGHLVPMDQPRNALLMLQVFVNGLPFAAAAARQTT